MSDEPHQAANSPTRKLANSPTPQLTFFYYFPNPIFRQLSSTLTYLANISQPHSYFQYSITRGETSYWQVRSPTFLGRSQPLSVRAERAFIEVR